MIIAVAGSGGKTSLIKELDLIMVMKLQKCLRIQNF